MALYRTERRLNWHHELRIGHWYAPWSQTQADTGADYFSRTLRWLRHRYPKADISAASHALPATDAPWPKERFGLSGHTAAVGESAAEAPQSGETLHDSGISQNSDVSRDGSASRSDSEQNDAEQNAKQQPAHAGDLLLIEWPQATTVPTAQPDTAATPTTQPDTAAAAAAATARPDATSAADSGATQHPAGTGAQPPLPDGELPPQWINGLERALRRNWQDNPLCEVILIGGTAGIDAKGLALAAHYGLAVLDPIALLRPAGNDTQDHRKALICDGQAGTPAILTPQGQEIWAGMLIGLLRDRIRVGPTPDPVSLPDGLWCR